MTAHLCIHVKTDEICGLRRQQKLPALLASVPCITLNNYTEHQETVSVGSNVLVGEDPAKLRETVRQMVAGEWKKCALPDRWDGRTAERILQILLA